VYLNDYNNDEIVAILAQDASIMIRKLAVAVTD
jgi:hypothetical protein